MKRAMLFVAGVCLALAPIFAGCGGSGNDHTGFAAPSGSDATADGARDGARDGTSSGGNDGSMPTDSSRDGNMAFGDGGSCPSTCQELGANCGPVTDTKCGGVVQCGSTCPMGSICGGGGMHNVCGSGGGNSDACSPLTCAGQNVTCGQAGDGCGNTLNCGSCTMPQTCGGDPSKLGQCGCTGVCQMVPTCPAGNPTTLSGTVYDPAGIHPLYNALVYVPNNPNDPGLQPFPAGISCDVCGATAAGDPLVSTYSAPDGSFTLSGVPIGASVPLVVQLGHWRRQFMLNVANSCTFNLLPAGTLTMPKTHVEGDIPRIALLTGGYDPVECTLRKMGVADSEFTDPGGGGHINFYTALGTGATTALEGPGAIISATTPAQQALMATSGGMPVIDQYDMTVLECEGYPQVESAADLATIQAYANAGGRLFASDFAYSWLASNFAAAASWSGPLNTGVTASPVTIDLFSNPKGLALDQWLQVIGVAPPFSDQVSSIYPAFHNTNGVVAPTQRWLWYTDPTTSSTAALHFTFNTPLGAASSSQCGRVVFSDWHAEQPTGTQAMGTWPHGATFPAECPSDPMTAQQAILEFMLFDLSACVQPYTPVCTPSTCMKEGIDCGPASDGCGNLLDCGKCTTGTCGGGGPGKCGTSTSCTPETCMAQGIECGQAGDGCGNAINCGNCPTGQICGLNGPGKCGATQ